MIPSAGTLESLRSIGDPIADEVVSQLFALELVADANDLFHILTRNSEYPADSHPGHSLLADYLHLTGTLPAFTDDVLIHQGSLFFQAHGPQIMTVLGAYSLPLDYAARKGVQVLARTARLTHHPNRRIVETAQMLIDVLQPNGLSAEGCGIRSVQKVRLIHAAVRYLIRTHDQTWRDDYGVPINQEDLLGTLLSFSYAVLDGLARLGIPASETEANGYFHCFRIVGYLMGIQPQLLPTSIEEAASLAQLIQQRQFGPSLEGIELTAALLRLMDEAYPWPLTGTGAALMRHLLGSSVANMLGVPESTWTAKETLFLACGSSGRRVIACTGAATRGQPVVPISHREH